MKRKWKTTITYAADTPQVALSKLLGDEYAVLFTSYIYIRPVFAERTSIDDLTKLDADRKIVKWEASTEVTLIGKIKA